MKGIKEKKRKRERDEMTEEKGKRKNIGKEER